MTLIEQATLRVDEAWLLGRNPQRWAVSKAVADELGTAVLAGLPVEIGAPRSEWGLDLVLAR